MRMTRFHLRPQARCWLRSPLAAADDPEPDGWMTWALGRMARGAVLDVDAALVGLPPRSEPPERRIGVSHPTHEFQQRLVAADDMHRNRRWLAFTGYLNIGLMIAQLDDQCVVV